jgi:hypothetical protein
MEVRDVRVEDSPVARGRVRLRGEVRYDGGGAEEYWFDVPAAHAEHVSLGGNPWLACLLPLASVLGEDVRVPLPVDAALLANAERLTRIWRTWYPDLSAVRVSADVARPVAPDARVSADVASRSPADGPGRVAAFFSGGVDSFFTILRDRERAPPAERQRIGDLITVLGFDIPLERPDAFARLCDRHERVAQRLGMELIDVATNLRATRWREAQWSLLAHGAGLASVALSLEGRFSAAYIAGGGGYRGLHPWGSHSVTDPLFSTRRTSIIYDGVAWLRTEKVDAIAESDAVHDALRVCYDTWTEENCGVCNKCLRTMVTLDVCGVLDRCSTFPRHSDLPLAVARMDVSHFADAREVQDIRQFAEARGRSDIVRALDRAVRRTRRLVAVRKGRRWAGAPVRLALSAFRRESS